MIKRSFNCTEVELYAVCDLGWQNCEDDLLDFAEYKAKYTSALIKSMLAKTKAAEDLPNATARYGPTTNLRNALKPFNDEVVDYFVMLKGYIKTAYKGDDEKIKTMMGIAGQKQLRSATTYVWTATQSLLSSVKDFLAKYKTDLITPDNMPQAFYDRFAKISNDFATAYKTWQKSDKDSYELTKQNAEANNRIYDDLRDILEDAQVVYRKNPDKAKQYTVEFLLSQVRGTKAAGAGGKVVIKGTKKTLSNVKVTLKELDKSVTTDADGRFEISPIASGFYTLSFELEGYETLIVEKYEVKVGTVGNFKTELVAIAETPSVI